MAETPNEPGSRILRLLHSFGLHPFSRIFRSGAGADEGGAMAARDVAPLPTPLLQPAGEEVSEEGEASER